ncbi:MAG TPA: hypothetical protein VFA11_04300 [Acidimicrobiales bacterium]|nr:hypothetical protein [Acidimicrobiales bacterium]
MASSREQRETLEQVHDPFARNTLRAAYHVRRYLLLYVCGALGALALAIFPTVTGGGGPGGSVAAGGAGGSYNGGAGGGSQAAGAAGGAGGASGGAVNGGAGGGGGSIAGGGAAGGAANPGPTGGALGSPASAGPAGPQWGKGTTRGGFGCAPGLRQLPFSAYAVPCEGAFTGSNGGSTWQGVTGDTILIGDRHTSDSQGANAQEANAFNQEAGGVTYQQAEGYDQKIIAYFNKTFELYGRQVKLVDYNGQGNYTNEELDTGQAAACADADTVAHSVKAFGDVDFEGLFEWAPFTDCAARYGVYVPQGAPYFPEWYYAQKNIHPYVWATTMNCQLIAQEVGEFIGKQVAPYPAKFAGFDGAKVMTNTTRKFGTWVPSNAEYQSCVQDTLNLDENTYHIPKGREDQYNYSLDISTFPNDAQRAITQFSANTDTTVVLACDPISPIFLTQDAKNQNYNPEWLIIGVAFTDTDNWGQLWDQTEVRGRLFGLSQAASTNQLLDPHGEAAKGLAAAGITGSDFNISSVTDYFLLMSMFNQLQAAGPDLTPANIALGTEALPPSSTSPAQSQNGVNPELPSGTWHFGTTHTAITDSREVYWNSTGQSTVGSHVGTYVEMYGGKRFGAGQFPTGAVPAYS